MIETIKFKFTGKSALMMHSDRMVDKLDPDVKDLAKLTALKKKPDEVIEQIARKEWDIGLYFDEKDGPIVPMKCITACLIRGARLSKMGKDLGRATFMESEFEPLEYKGPRSKDALWKAGYSDRRSVGVGQSRVMRCRPIFREKWSFEFELGFDAEAIQREHIVDAAVAAGKYVGLMELRPELGGCYGRFNVEAAQ